MAFVWRKKYNLGWRSPLSTVWKKISFTLAHHCVHQPSWPVSSWDSSVSASILSVRGGIVDMYYHAWLYVILGIWSGPHTCETILLSRDMSSQPDVVILIWNEEFQVDRPVYNKMCMIFLLIIWIICTTNFWSEMIKWLILKRNIVAYTNTGIFGTLGFLYLILSSLKTHSQRKHGKSQCESVDSE